MILEKKNSQNSMPDENLEDSDEIFNSPSKRKKSGAGQGRSSGS